MSSINIVLTVLLVMGLFLAISLQKTYAALPLRELKRRARSGDVVAACLYSAVGYGHSLRALLWFLIGLTGGGLFVSVALLLPIWAALLATSLLIWLVFVWVPSGRVTKLGDKAARAVAPFLAWLLNYLHPPIDWMSTFLRRHRPIHVHTGMYQTDDLVRLIEQQQAQTDNRIDSSGLSMARNALLFKDIIVRDVLTPKRMVTMVKADDSVGPILMTELYASGHSRFPVYEGKKDAIVGILYLRDLVTAQQSSTVKTIMQDTVCYVHEDRPISDALQAVLKTHQQLFVVVNNFEEFVGVLSVEDILEQIIGQPIIDEFDQYQNLRAVATRDAKNDRVAHRQVDATIEL
ncbi:MAG: hypothetical protein NVS1B7_1260 [Candidatus Saccharimonadales bacterium]